MIPKTAGSLDTLLLQLGSKGGEIVGTVGGVATVKDAMSQLAGMKLVFDSPARQMLLKKALTALTNLDATLAKTASGAQFGAAGPTPSSSATATSSSSGLKGAALLNSPMVSKQLAATRTAQQRALTLPALLTLSFAAFNLLCCLFWRRIQPHIERATVVFDPANMRTGPAFNDGVNHNIKPVNKMTFSSAESSASARLGVAGKCSVCNAHREPGTAFCTSCGKNSNIIF